ncbi:MAG: tail fiber domain-containing protein, partial [Anaerolineales bacterium]|nr:tail fiber domain-containing protein [Anaerolineales bacterium]
TADKNTAIGYGSLTGNTTGEENTSLGANSLVGNTTADKNTAIGSSSLEQNSTGASNVAVGRRALYANSTASNNTAVGYHSLYANTTGATNTAVGSLALDAVTGGGANTAVGYEALTSCGGSSHVAVGHGAGSSITTGVESVCIGYRSGNYSTDLVDGDGCTIIGAYAHTSATDSNAAVVLGYNVSGEAGYTTIGNGTADIRAEHGVATWATVSDERFKENIKSSSAGLDFINELRPVTFTWKPLGEIPTFSESYEDGSVESYRNDTVNHGFIAQEVKAAIDKHSEIEEGFKAWSERTDGQQEVAEGALVPMLVKAIQELSAEVEELKAKLEE